MDPDMEEQSWPYQQCGDLHRIRLMELPSWGRRAYIISPFPIHFQHSGSSDKDDHVALYMQEI